MVLECFDRRYTEYELTTMTLFSYNRGTSMPMMVEICKVLGLRWYLNKQSNIEELSNILAKGYYPIILTNPGILYFSIKYNHLHAVVVKGLVEGKAIINDPDQEFGGENKPVEVGKFLAAWRSKKVNRWLFVIEGEISVGKG